MLTALAMLFGQGLLHGVGPDHCLAIGALASRGGLREALRVSVRFGVGHTVVLALLAFLAALAGVVIPAAWESRLEVVGGVSLLALGIWTLASKGDAVPHIHADGTAHAHTAPDAETTTKAATPGWMSGLAGAVFGLSGVRALVLVLPLAVRQHGATLALGVLLFGVGVVLSMVAVGFVTQRAAKAASQRASIERGLRVLVGGASVLCGAWWVVDHTAG